MAWNPQKKPNQGLPDLEAHLKKFFKSLFIAHKPSGDAPNQSPHHPAKTWATIFGVLLSMWAVSGIYQVQPGQQAIVSSFGKMQTVSPGWHWYARLIEQKYVIDTSQVISLNLNDALISQDKAVLSLQLNIQYQVKNAEQYLFNMSNFSNSLQQIMEAKLTQDVGGITLGQLLQDNSTLNQTLQQQIQQVCDQYNMGVSINSVAVQNVTVPDAVSSVLNSMKNAAQTSLDTQNQAQQQASTALQAAQTQAAQIIKQAQDQAALAVPKAQREVAEFLAILPAYKDNPQVTRERMYYDTMQKVYSSGHVIVVDSNASVKLPDNLWQGSSIVQQPIAAQAAPASQSVQQPSKSLSAYLRWKEAQQSES
ncbi:MAG: rane protease subunit HflK [Gammaproteobacteria bacterium]|jgi:membrane protease subunit HflK|nr:rane protease subunit HflK [Gammaproteobacteria bacterium]